MFAANQLRFQQRFAYLVLVRPTHLPVKPVTAHLLARSYAIFIFAGLLFDLAAQVFPALGIPNYAINLSMLISLVGCPVGVILLWIFSRPQILAAAPVRRLPSLFWAVLALAIVSAIGCALVATPSVEPVGLFLFIVFLLPGPLAAFGLWYGRRWGWWLQLFSSLINLLLFPVGTMIAGLGIVFLLWIRPAYFRLSTPSVPAQV